MPLFDLSDPAPPTIADLQAKTKTTVINNLKDSFELLVRIYSSNRSVIYDNPFGLSVADAQAAFTTEEYAELKHYGDILKDLINAIQPGYYPPDPVPPTP